MQEKKLIDKLVGECSENVDGNEMIYNSTLNDYEKIQNYCTAYIVLLAIFFIISISINSVFIYLHQYLKRRYTETIIYQMKKWEISKKLTFKIEHITFLMTQLILMTLIQTY